MIDTLVKTAIYLHGKVDPNDLYDQGVDAMFRYHNLSWANIHRIEMPVEGHPDINMIAPMGPPTKMMVTYRPNGAPLSDEGDFLLRHATCNNTECTPDRHYPAHEQLIAFATDNNYTEPRNNWNSAQLHAAFIYRIGEWLDTLGIKWSWATCLTDEIHEGYNNLSKMEEWFKEYQQKLAYQAAMMAMGPVVPVNSLAGLVILANKVAAQQDDDEDEDEDWEDPYADYKDDED